MSSLFRLTQGFRPTKALPKTMPFFHPSNTALGRIPNLGRARFYKPQSPKSRILDQTSNMAAKQTIIYGLIGVNTTVFCYGIYAKAQAQQGFPGKFHTYIKNMTLNLNEFVNNKRWWTTITSNYTHLSLTHIACNMFVFYTMSTFLVHLPIITPGRLLILVFGSGLLGSAGSLWDRSRKVGPGGRDRTIGFGFSGALMGVSTVAACYFPTAQMLVFGIIPIPLWVLTAGYAVWDGYFLNDNSSRTGHAGHLGGMVFGAIYYLTRLRGLRF